MDIEGTSGDDLGSVLTLQGKKAVGAAVSQQQTLEKTIERL